MTELKTEDLKIRPPAVAGMFYPGDAGELRAMVRQMIDEGRTRCSNNESGGFPKAVIAPHAGYQYSGAIAGSAYAAIEHGRGHIRRVVLIGPAHRVGFAGVATCNADAFACPMGTVPVDREAVKQLDGLYFVHSLDQAHALDHALEVQLPFLIEALGGGDGDEIPFSIVPLLAGQIGYQQIAELYETLWGGDETLILISSDLSHYKDYQSAVKIDNTTATMINNLQSQSIAAEQACGHVAIQGLLEAAHQRGMRVEQVDLRNSGDTAGPKNQVVGYGAFLFWTDVNNNTATEQPDQIGQSELLNDDDRQALMEIVRSSIAHGLKHHQPLKVKPEKFSPTLQTRRAVFVTLKIGERLRGCIGNLEPVTTLVEDTSRNAFAAAFSDPRFPPLAQQEFEHVHIHLSILTTPQSLSFTDEQDLLKQMRPGIDGLILEQNGHRGTFLPSVWETLKKPEVFLAQLKIKAGLPPDPLDTNAKIWRYEAESVE